MEFSEVKQAFVRGDPRPLAAWVLSKDMTNKEKEFVVKALCGDIEKTDGRTVKPASERMLNDYDRLRFLDYTLECFDPENYEKRTDADISRKLADKYSYQDADSVRRALSNHA